MAMSPSHWIYGSPRTNGFRINLKSLRASVTMRTWASARSVDTKVYAQKLLARLVSLASWLARNCGRNCGCHTLSYWEYVRSNYARTVCCIYLYMWYMIYMFMLAHPKNWLFDIMFQYSKWTTCWCPIQCVYNIDYWECRRIPGFRTKVGNMPKTTQNVWLLTGDFGDI